MTMAETPEEAVDELVDTVDRLRREFPDVGMTDVLSVVADCRRDLSAVPPRAVPELTERLARVRLADRSV